MATLRAPDAIITVDATWCFVPHATYTNFAPTWADLERLCGANLDPFHEFAPRLEWEATTGNLFAEIDAVQTGKSVSLIAAKKKDVLWVLIMVPGQREALWATDTLAPRDVETLDALRAIPTAEAWLARVGAEFPDDKLRQFTLILLFAMRTAIQKADHGQIMWAPAPLDVAP